MATPYLKQPNYIGAMQAGLSSRLAYDKAGRRRTVGGGGRSNVIKRTEQAAPLGSPEARAEYRKNVLLEEAAGEKVKQLKTETAKDRYMTTAKGIETAAGFAPQLTPENYDDWFNWVGESDFLPTDMFMSPSEVKDFTPSQFEEYAGKIGKLGKVDDKTVGYAIKQYDAETKRMLGEQRNILAREKEAERKQEVKDRNILTGKKYTDLTADQKSDARFREEDRLVELEKEITGEYEDGTFAATDIKGSKSSVDAFNRKAKELGINEKYEVGTIASPVWYDKSRTIPGYVKVTTAAPTKVAPVKSGAMDSGLLNQYKEKYPNRTEEEIIKAYNRSK